MNTAIAPSQSKIVAEINELFEHYGPTFVDLAIGKRSDLNALLDFYGAPLRFIGSNFHMVMKDDDAITGEEGIGGEIRRLRQAHFAGSTLDKCDIKILNKQAAVVDAVWLRQNSDGAVTRFSVMYLVAQTSKGWRITSAIDLSA
jgi:uncharacterized NTF2-like protein DUF6841